MSPRRRTQAAKEIADLGETQEALAERWGVTTRTLQRWLVGDATPRQKERERLHAAGGPSPEAWDEVLPESARPPPRAPSTSEASRDGTRLAADTLHRIVADELASLQETGPDEDRPRWLRQCRELTAMIVQLGDLTGAAVIDEKRIVASPAWQRVSGAVADALRPWPEALEAVARALEGAAA